MEFEPDFRGPLWESAATSAAKNSNKSKKNSGSSGLAEEDASTVMKENSSTTEVGSSTSSSSPRSVNDSGLSSRGLSDASGECWYKCERIIIDWADSAA